MADIAGRLDGKVVVITGATGGIGLETARALARLGSNVIIVGHDAERTRQVADELLAQNSGSIKGLVADLSSQAEVRRLASEIAAQEGRLDALINNAGAVFAKRRYTADGIEMTLALNHLAPFLLTNLLLETLKASAPARVITVASMAHAGARIPFADMNHQRRRWSSFGVYGETKLMNIMFTYELARRLAGSGVTANALHPGFVASNFGKNNGGVWKSMFSLAQPFAISAREGAQTSIFLASSPEVAGMSGEYFVRKKPAKSSPASYDQEAQAKLWRVSEEMTGPAASMAG